MEILNTIVLWSVCFLVGYAIGSFFKSKSLVGMLMELALCIVLPIIVWWWFKANNLL